MPRPAASSGLHRLRLALLIAIVLVVGGVGGLYWLGRASRPAPEAAPPAAPASGAAPAGEQEPVVLSEGFDYEQQIAGKPAFRLQGERFTTDRSGKVALDGVRLVLYRDGEPYEVRSRTAIYDPETQDAELDGDVKITGGDGWEISGARLDLVGNGRTILSRQGRVRFRRGANLAGSARRLRYQLEEQELQLTGEVVVAGREEPAGRQLGLAAEKLTWQRDGSSVIAEGAVRLDAGGDELSAERIHARLSADGGAFESATASGGVTGHLRGEGGARLDFTAAGATVAFDAATGDPTSVLLAAGKHAAEAELVMAQAQGLARRLTAPTVLLELLAGKPSRASASTGVVMREQSPAGPERSARGERLAATFSPGGELATAELTGKVRLEEDRWRVDGDVLKLLDGGGSSTVTGRPARAQGERGDLRAPTLRIDRGAARLDASGGVRARFRPAASPIASGDPASASQPVDVEAREATFYDAPRRFEFREAVQAVQGESLLFADRLEGNDVESTATARGKVRTQWTDRSPVSTGGAPVITVVNAETLVYLRGAAKARYEGGVKIRQERREISGDTLEVELAEGGRARRMLVEGAVAIDDRETGRSIRGDSADYDLESGEVIVLGEPVTLREQSGTTLRGRRVLFDQRTGSARLLSGDS